LTYTSKLTVRAGYERIFTTKDLYVATSQHMEHRSLSWIRYSNSHESYKDCLYRVLLLTRKSSLWKFMVAIMTWLTVTEYLCHKWPR